MFLLFEASDLKKAQEFGASADLKDTMAKAGVIEKPDITFFD